MGLGLGQWILIILIAISSDSIAMEYKENTIKTLFFKHPNKLLIYASKYLVIALYGLFLIFLSFVSIMIIKSLFIGSDYSWFSIYKNNLTLIASLLLNMLGALLYILFSVSLGFLLICLTKINSLVIGIGLFLGFVGSYISTALISNLGEFAFILKWNPFNMIYIVNQLANSRYISFSHLSNVELILSSICYSIIFFFLGLLIFKHKKV
ncbi:ABC transporter permease [Enterococcus sp. DIV0086]|uniref:ABC transporter permease n=1 Tax=Enterococcus sp. DIV0086 TaxID=2774655 RepID=UPI003D2BFDBE